MSADSGDSRNIGTPSGGTVLLVVVLLIIAGGVWFIRPWLHGVVYGVYTTPVFWLGIPISVGVLVLVYGRIDNTSVLEVSAVACIIALLALSSVSGTFAANTLGQTTMQDSQTVEELRETDASSPRILTKSVADRYATNTLNFPQYQVSESDITIQNGTPSWSYALSPDGFWNHLTKKQHGTVMVDMTRQNASVRTVTDDMNKGIGTAFYNNYKWHILKKGEYLASYEDPFMVMDENEQYIAVPYTVPKFHWLPVPHTTPTWGGVMLLDSTGNVTDLSPKEARQHPVLEGQKLYPFDLTRRAVTATKYRNGIINTFTSHNDQIEVAPVPGDGNSQPFLLPTTDGPTLVVAAEPYGNARGLSEIWMVDARTGEYHRYAPNESLFGPQKAAALVRKAAPKTDWNRFTPAEPIPVVVDGQLFWEIRIVPNDNSGISYTAFVNAQNSTVREVETTTNVTKFLQNAPVPDRDTGSNTRSDGQNGSETPSIIVERVAPNGTVIGTMTVYGNESVRIVRGNGNETTNRTTENTPKI